MIALPIMLVGPAEEAGMKVPENPDEYDSVDYPHWHVFLSAQLGIPLPSPASHWHNAKIVADIPNSKIKKVTPENLIELGFEHGGALY